MSAPRRQAARYQARLDLTRDPALDRASFIVSPGNAEALAAMDGWRTWPDPRLVLVGPANAGKSHLAAIWMEATNARRVRGVLDAVGDPGSAVLLEDADKLVADEALFHLLNAAEAGRPILMTARTPPREWQTTIPDLRSRLNALRVIELAAPDDDVLLGLLEKFFRERNIKPDPDVAPYLAIRIERSAAAAAAIVARIDEAAAAERREITRAFASRIFEREAQARDLFD